MNAVAFQSDVEGSTIQIPPEYRGFFDSTVLVTLINLPKPRQERKAFTLDDFAPANIDTRGWKFNREEANER